MNDLAILKEFILFAMMTFDFKSIQGVKIPYTAT